MAWLPIAATAAQLLSQHAMDAAQQTMLQMDEAHQLLLQARQMHHQEILEVCFSLRALSGAGRLKVSSVEPLAKSMVMS